MVKPHGFCGPPLIIFLAFDAFVALWLYFGGGYGNGMIQTSVRAPVPSLLARAEMLISRAVATRIQPQHAPGLPHTSGLHPTSDPELAPADKIAMIAETRMLDNLVPS